jgi:hypothetical protein
MPNTVSIWQAVHAGIRGDAKAAERPRIKRIHVAESSVANIAAGVLGGWNSMPITPNNPFRGRQYPGEDRFVRALVSAEPTIV